MSEELFSGGFFAEDIMTVNPHDIPDFDILTAGFPCQPFSLAGLQKGFADPRGTIFFEIIRILEAKKPKAFFLENVRNLISHDKGRTFATIRHSLESLGYSFHFKVVKACEFGLPQYRPRVFMIGFKNKETQFTFPE
jgi:DNA (cytosine-5)-methyltransferase 1